MKKVFTLAVAAMLVSGISAAETFSQVMKDAHAFRGKGQYAKAIAAFQKARKLAVSQNDKFSSAFFTGVTQGERKLFDESLATFQEAMQLAKFPSQKLSVQFHIAYHLGIQGKYAEALTEMEKAEAFDPEAKSAYTIRAKISRGQYMLALKKYDKIIETVQPATLYPNPDISIYAYSVIYETNKRLKNNDGIKAAVEGMKKLNCKTMSGIFTQKRLNYEYCRMIKDFDNALKLANEISATKGMPVSYRDHGFFYAALTYEAMKQPQKALEMWKSLDKSTVPGIRKTAQDRIAKASKKK